VAGNMARLNDSWNFLTREQFHRWHFRLRELSFSGTFVRKRKISIELSSLTPIITEPLILT